MATQNDFSRSFPVNSAMSHGYRVSVSSNGAIGLSTATDYGVGVLQQDAQGASFESPKVRFYYTGSSDIAVTAVTAYPITPGSIVFLAAGGMVAQTGSLTFGVALESPVENGDLIEVVPNF